VSEWPFPLVQPRSYLWPQEILSRAFYICISTSLLRGKNTIVRVQRMEWKRKSEYPWRQKRGHKYLRPPFSRPRHATGRHVSTPPPNQSARKICAGGAAGPTPHHTTPPTLTLCYVTLPKHPWPHVVFPHPSFVPFFSFSFYYSILLVVVLASKPVWLSLFSLLAFRVM